MAITVFGVLLSLTFTPIMLAFVCVVAYKKPDKFNTILPAYFLSVFALSYNIHPNYTNDLMRYFAQMDMCRDMPIKYAFSWAEDGLVIKNFIFWVFSKLDDNYLLPAIVMAVLYSVSAYIAYHCLQNKKNLWKILLSQVLLLPVFEAHSNVRNMLAFSFIILAVYRDLAEDKKGILTLILYLAPCFIHMTGVVLVILRIGVLFLNKHPFVIIGCVIALPAVVLGVTSVVSSVPIPGPIGKIVNRLLFKARASVLNTSEYAVNMSNSGYFKACRAVLFVVFVAVIIISLMTLRHSINHVLAYETMLAGIVVVLIVMGTVKYWVFAVAGIILMPVAFNAAVETPVARVKIRQALIGTIFAFSFLRGVLELYYLQSRIVVEDFFEGVIINNTVVILGEILYHILY